jgi:hypothetical protein
MSEELSKEFEGWWDKNEEAYLADSCHMSEFHMASIVWQAATAAKQAEIDELRAVNKKLGNTIMANALIIAAYKMSDNYHKLKSATEPKEIV